MMARDLLYDSAALRGQDDMPICRRREQVKDQMSFLFSNIVYE